MSRLWQRIRIGTADRHLRATLDPTTDGDTARVPGDRMARPGLPLLLSAASTRLRAAYHPGMTRQPRIRIESLHVADFIHPDGSPLAGRTGIVMAHAVVHPGGVLLFDTGIGFGDAEIEEAYRPVVRDIDELLIACGIDPDDVTELANSHLHFDHCGQNGAFPDRPIHVQAAEFEAAKAPDYTIPAWVDVPGACYVLHSGEVELAPGIRLVPTLGHTPGHQSLLIDAGGERIAVLGQAVYTRAEWAGSDDPAVSGHASAWDREAYQSSVERLRGFEPVIVLFGHDR